MRSSNHHDPERGLLAALKVVAIAAAVVMLGMVAGKSSYTPVPGAVVSPAYVLPARATGPGCSTGGPRRSAIRCRRSTT